MRKPLIIITGASSGIGEATARQLSALGYPLLLLARRIERLQALALPHTLCRQVDVTDAAALHAAVAEAEAQYGAADALVNNAGVMLLGRMHEQDPAEWQRMLDVNVRGVLNGIHAVLAGMMARRHGTIINVSSIAGRQQVCRARHQREPARGGDQPQRAGDHPRPRRSGNRAAGPHHQRQHP